MTLIAAFKCAEGYTICADTNETVEDESGVESHRTRQKLVPIKMGQLDVSIAGAGDGDLIDAFVERLRVNYRASTIEDPDSIPPIIKSELASFAKDKGVKKTKIGATFRFLIGAYCPTKQTFNAWYSAAGDLIEIQTYELVGYEDTRYDYAVRNLYHPGLPTSQAVFLGLYVMWLGEQTSKVIKAPVTVVTLTRAGLRFEDQAKIDRIDQKVRLFTAQFENQFLSCSDTSIQNTDFANKFKEFGRTIIQFRQDFIAEWVGAAVEMGLEKFIEPWNEVPAGTTIVLDAQSAEHQRIQQMIVDTLRQNEDGKQDRTRLLANLAIILNNRQKRLLKYQNPEGLLIEELTNLEKSEDVRAFTELDAAARMGAFRVSQEVINVVARALSFVTGNLLFGEHIELQIQCIAIQQAIGFIERTMPLNPSGDSNVESAK